MHRETKEPPIIVPAIIIGLVAVALAAITGTGPDGTYAFGFIGITGYVFFTIWLEIRKPPPNREHHP